jgi:hypothetical protein
VARATQPALAGVRNAEELCEAITAACCEYSDGNGAVFPDLARALFDGLPFHLTLVKIIVHCPSGSRNKLAGVLDKLAGAIGPPPIPGLDRFRLVVQAAAVGPEAVARALTANAMADRSRPPNPSPGLTYRARLEKVALGQTEGVFEDVRATAAWPERVAGLMRESEPAPQLWLRCAKVSMAAAILGLRSEATDAYLRGLPRLVEDADGSAGIEFRLNDGRQVVPLVKELLTGDYGPDKPVINNAVACGMPPGDDKQLVRLLGLEEALGLGSVMSW